MLLTAPLKDMGFEPQIKQILDEAFEGSEDMVTEPGQVWAFVKFSLSQCEDSRTPRWCRFLIVTPELKLHDFWIYMARRSFVARSIGAKSL